MREVYFHEDDYCQIEVLPLSNLDFCLHQAGLIDDFSEEHKSGAGYNEIFIREESPNKLSELNITADKVRECLSSFQPEYDKVYTGYSSYRELCNNVLAFGQDNEETIFVQINEENIVQTVWCSDLLEGILNLPYTEELLLADWSSDLILPLSDRAQIMECVKQREIENIEFIKKFESRKTEAESIQYPMKKRWWEFWK